MNHISRRAIILSLTLVALFIGIRPASAAPKKSEQQLIEMLKSHDHDDVIDALDRLPNWYPNSTNALPYIRELLKMNNFEASRPPEPKPLQKRLAGKGDATSTPVMEKPAGNRVSRKAARALGNYHATLEPGELRIVLGFLKHSDPDVVMDGLKTLRGLKVPEVVPQLVPLLQNPNHNILRDTCRTLAVLGDKSVIPQIQPLLKDMRRDVKKDAANAIAALQAKP
jgi:HEAT repeat protein